MGSGRFPSCNTSHPTHIFLPIQRRILDAAVQLVRPGGTLVFSTCTFNPGENEANVRYVLDTYPGLMVLEQQSPRLGGPGLTASAQPMGRWASDAEGTGSYLSAGGETEFWLSAEEAGMVQRFDPRGDTIGFFVAKFRRLSI